VKIKVIRSFKRRKTVSARLKGGVLELRVPVFLTPRQVNQYAQAFLTKFNQKKALKNDSFLKKRAKLLAKKYLERKLPSYQITWSTRQQRIFGICNKKTRNIRISARLKKVPSWVLDYVILHELAHLLFSGHGKDFWQAVGKYPKTELAKAFLKGVVYAQGVNK